MDIRIGDIRIGNIRIGKKPIGCLLLALAAFLVLSPPIFGWLYQRYYQQQIDFFNSIGPIHVDIQSYQKHWWTSDVVLSVQIDSRKIFVGNTVPKNMNFSLRQQIQHGPVFYHSIGSIPLGLGFARVSHTFGIAMGHYLFAFASAHTEGGYAVHNDKLSFNREVDIEKIAFAKENIGPIYLSLSGHLLNDKAFEDIITAYRTFFQEGDIYQGQLKGKLIALIPQLFTPGASLEFNTLSIKAPQGRLEMEGKIFWPTSSYSSPDDLDDLMNNMPLEFSLRASQALIDEWLDFAAGLPYLQDYTREERQHLLDMEDDINLTFQQNNMLLGELIYFRLLPQNAGEQLLILAKDHDLADRYLANVKTLFLSKDISREIAYLLYFQFSQLQHNVELFENAVAQHQKEAKDSLISEFHDWIKLGYVSRERNDYVMKVARENGKIILNGKPFVESKKS